MRFARQVAPLLNTSMTTPSQLKQRFDDLIHEVQSSNLSDKAKAYLVPLLEDEADREQQALILFGQGDNE